MDEREEMGKAVFLLRGRRVILDLTLADWSCTSVDCLRSVVQTNQELLPEPLVFCLDDDERRSLVGMAIDPGFPLEPVYALTIHGVIALSAYIGHPDRLVMNPRIVRLLAIL